jgi:hypothetical protein
LISQSIVSNCVKTLIKELLYFVFPSYCVHCEEEEVEAGQLFCFYCCSLIERAPLDSISANAAVAVERQGVGYSLLQMSHSFCQQETIKTMAAWIVLQLLDLPWPKPDLIIPSPEDSANHLLSKEVAHFLQVPMKPWLLSRTRWRRPGILSDRVVLVVGLTLGPYLDILEEAAPSQIFQIGFCEGALQTFY